MSSSCSGLPLLLSQRGAETVTRASSHKRKLNGPWRLIICKKKAQLETGLRQRTFRQNNKFKEIGKNGQFKEQGEGRSPAECKGDSKGSHCR